MRVKTIYRFKVTLHAGPGNLDENRPYAQILINSFNNLSTLAQVILKAFKFNYDHPYGFYSSLTDPFNAKEKYELFTEIDDIEPTDGALGVTHTHLSKVFPVVGKEMLFLFDYGNYWQFTIALEHASEYPPNIKVEFPVILKVTGKLPKQYTRPKEENEEFDDNYPLRQEIRRSGFSSHLVPPLTSLKRRTRPN